MTVTSSTNKQFANGDGVSQTFFFYYRLELATDMQVYVDGVQLTSGFTVSINSNGYGGSVTITPAPDAGIENVLLVREVDYLQNTHFPNENDFDQVSLEDAVDKLAMGEQQLQEEISRAVLWNLTVPNVPNLELPVPIQGDVIGWGMVPAPSPPGGLEVGLVNLPNIGTGPAGPTGSPGPTGPTGATGAASSGSLITLQTQTVSGASSVVFTGINSTYAEYAVHYNDTTFSSVNTFYMQISEDGGTTWKTPNYAYSAFQSSGGVTSGTNQLGIVLAGSSINDVSGSITFYDPAVVRQHFFSVDNIFLNTGTSMPTRTQVAATYTGDTGAYNAIKFFPSTGTFSGTFTLFGVSYTPGTTGVGPTGPTGPTGPSGATILAGAGHYLGSNTYGGMVGGTMAAIGTGQQRFTYTTPPATTPKVMATLVSAGASEVISTNTTSTYTDFYTYAVYGGSAGTLVDVAFDFTCWEV